MSSSVDRYDAIKNSTTLDRGLATRINEQRKYMNRIRLLKSKQVRLVSLTVVAASTIFIAGTNVFAGLNATVSATNTDSSGTLILTNANNGVGFSQSMSNLAPGDVVNRYVTLTNGGSLDAQSLGLAITATGTPTLITDGVSPATTKALTVAIFSCTGGTWNTSTGACSGTTNTEVAATSLSAFSLKKSFAVTSTLASAGTSNLQIQVTLPDQNETTVNGVLPTSTVQGGSVSLSYLFSEAQRTSTTSNS